MKTETLPIASLDASAVKKSNVNESIPSASERGIEARTTGTIVEKRGHANLSLIRAVTSDGILVATYAIAPAMTP